MYQPLPATVDPARTYSSDQRRETAVTDAAIDRRRGALLVEEDGGPSNGFDVGNDDGERGYDGGIADCYENSKWIFPWV